MGRIRKEALVQVHQFHSTVSYGDAVGNQIQSLQRMLRHMGYRSEVFCESLPMHFKGHVRQRAEYALYSAPENILLVHVSQSYSREIMSWLAEIPDRKVAVYHNITPYTFFVGINELYMEAVRVGREQLGELGALCEAGWGVSAFNCQELLEKGWAHVGVLPIIFDPGRYAVRADRAVLRGLKTGFNVLFVGRVAPNKHIEDLILAFYYLKHFVRKDARLLLVGSARGMDRYLEFLQELVRRLGLSDVIFAGHVSTPSLVAYYQCAGVYLSMSEHEGFGVPLLEGMHFSVPIVAYKACAVPETLGGTGILFKDKDHAAVAELIGLLGEEQELGARITERQHERLRDFLPARIEPQLEVLLHDI